MHGSSLWWSFWALKETQETAGWKAIRLLILHQQHGGDTVQIVLVLLQLQSTCTMDCYFMMLFVLSMVVVGLWLGLLVGRCCSSSCLMLLFLFDWWHFFCPNAPPAPASSPNAPSSPSYDALFTLSIAVWWWSPNSWWCSSCWYLMILFASSTHCSSHRSPKLVLYSHAPYPIY